MESTARAPLWGYSYIKGDNTSSHAFSYSGCVLTELAPYLASIGIVSEKRATAIDDNGDIVGWGEGTDRYVHPFVLMVPEPSAVALLALGLAGFIFRRRRSW